MNTFQMNPEIMETLIKISLFGETLEEDYDEEVIAHQAGVKIQALTSKILLGEHSVETVNEIKDLARSVKQNYDEEVIAYDIGNQILTALKQVGL